jgi:hypothetical protein
MRVFAQFEAVRPAGAVLSRFDLKPERLPTLPDLEQKAGQFGVSHRVSGVVARERQTLDGAVRQAHRSTIFYHWLTPSARLLHGITRRSGG